MMLSNKSRSAQVFLPVLLFLAASAVGRAQTSAGVVTPIPVTSLTITQAPSASGGQGTVTASQPAPNAPAAAVMVPKGTAVNVILNQSLSSGSSKVGAQVPFLLATPILGPGNEVVVPAYTPAYGHVIRSSKAGMFGSPGKLVFTCDYISGPNNTRIPLVDKPLGRTGASGLGTYAKSEGESAGMSAVISGASPSIGPGAVIGLFHSGPSVSEPAGTVISMYIGQDTSIVPSASPAALPRPLANPGSNGSTMIVVNQSVFTLKDGNHVVGVVSGFDGSSYTVSTTQGMKTIPASTVSQISPLSSTVQNQ